MLRAFLALALFAYPQEFRQHYRSQVLLDLEDRRQEASYALRLLTDVLVNGVVMRAELFLRDVTYAVRVLRKAPLFTAVVVGTLAVAIAANTVAFSVIEAVLLQPLPYAHVDQLAIVSLSDAKNEPGKRFWAPVPFIERLAHSPLVEAAGGAMPSQTQTRVSDRIETLRRGYVTSSYFSTLGVTPYLGRFFTQSQSASQIVLSYAYWRAHYASDPAALGRSLVINGSAFSIVAVAPPRMLAPEFGAAAPEDVWTIISHAKAAALGAFPIVRLRSGVSITAFDAELARLWRASVAHDSNEYDPGQRPSALGLSDAVLSNTESVWILLGAAATVLLIACANVANLILARSAARQAEFALRGALGAGAGRIVAQSMSETLVLCAAGCIFGAFIAWALLHAVIALLPGNLPRIESTRIDLPVVLYVCALAVTVTLLAGIAPALRAARTGIARRRTPRLVTGLVSLEIGAAFTLLVCSILLLRSFLLMTSQPLGFDPRNAYSASFLPLDILDVARFGEMPHLNAAVVAGRIADRVRALPGVSGAAVALEVPFANKFKFMEPFWLQGERKPRDGDREHQSEASEISPGYFSLMRIPVLQGRSFTSADANVGNVAVVNQAFVHQFFKGRRPALGEIVFRESGAPIRIVGIVADTRDSLTQPPAPVVYAPFTGKMFPAFQVVLRTKHPDPHLAEELAAVARQLYPFGIPPVTSMNDAVSKNAADARAAFLLIASLTLIALILALAGIYGIVAFAVERRQHEIGIRLAVGARTSDVLRRVIGAALSQSLIGIAGGVIAAALAARAIETQLFQTPPFDPVSFAGAAAVLLVCTAFAAAVPAWRAVRAEPARILRYE